MDKRRLGFVTFAIAIAGNELRQLIRSRTRLLLSLVILPLFFTSTLGGSSGGEGTRFSATAHVPMAFIDEDLTASSSRLHEALVRSGDFDRLIQGYRTENAISALGTGEIFAAIIVPKGFQSELENGRTGRVVLYTDDGASGLDQRVLSNLRLTLMGFSATQGKGQAKQSTSFRIQIIERSRSFSGFAIGLTIVIAIVQIFATFYEIAGGISREREDGTYARLLLSPAGVGSVILGKTLYDLLINLIRTLIVLAIAVYGFGANLGVGVEAVIVISVLIALITMGFGFLVSAIRVGVRTVVILEFFLVLSLFSFSGLIIDRELMRGYAQTISFLLPWSYGFDAMRKATLMGGSLLEMGYELQLMGISILVFYTLSYFLLSISRERLAV